MVRRDDMVRNVPAAEVPIMAVVELRDSLQAASQWKSYDSSDDGRDVGVVEAGQRGGQATWSLAEQQ